MRNAFKAIGAALVCALSFSPALTQTAMANTLPAALTQPSSEQQKANPAPSTPNAESTDAADPAQTSADDPSKTPGQNPPSQTAADQTSPSEAKPNATSSSQSPSIASKPSSTESNHLESGTVPSKTKPNQNGEAADAASSAQRKNADESASDSQTQDKQNDTAVTTSPEENPKQQATVGPQSSCAPVPSQRWGDSDVTWSIDASCTLHISGGTSPDIRPEDGTTHIPWIKDDSNSTYVSYRTQITAVSIEGNLTVTATKEAQYLGTYPNDYCTGLFSVNKLSQFSITTGAALTLKDSAAAYMFSKCGSLTGLNLTNFNTSKVTNMSYMFYYCSSLTGLNLSNFDTSNVTDMSGMFAVCLSLSSLNLSNFDTSNVTNMSDMFGNYALSSLNLSNFDTSNVTDMSGMFENCSNLTSLNLTNFNTTKVADMHGMFNGCSNLTSLNLTNFNTTNTTDMSRMFSFCSNLTSLNLSNFNTSNVTNMNSMFYGCTGLTNLNLTNFNTTNTTNMSNMFRGCDRLATLVLGLKTKIDSDTRLRDANWTRMYGSPNPAKTGITTDQLYTETQQGHAQGTYVVNGGLSSASYTLRFNLNGGSGTTPQVLSGTTGSTVTLPQFTGISRNGYAATSWNTQPDGNGSDYQAGSTFYPAAGYTTLYVKWVHSCTPVGSTPWGDSDVRWSIDAGCTLHISGGTSPDIRRHDEVTNTDITDIPWVTNDTYRSEIAKVIIEGNLTVKATKEAKPQGSAPNDYYTGLFASMSNLGQFSLAPSATLSLQDQAAAYMFYFCRSLTNLDLSNLNTTNVTNMSSMFYNCNRLTSLNLSNLNTTNVTNMSSMFSSCTSLTSLNLSKFDTSNVTNMSNMFSMCSSLTSLDLSKFDTSKVTDMSSMFYNMRTLTTLDLTGWDTSKVTDMSYMFAGIPLATLDLSEWDTGSVSTMNSMFYNMRMLTKLNLTGWDTSKVTDMSCMFKNLQTLSVLDLSGFDTSSVIAMNDMFYSSPNLSTLDLSSWDTSNVQNMQNMFSYVSNLKTLDLSGWDTGNVTNMDQMFYTTNNLKRISIGAKTKLSNATNNNVSLYNATWYRLSGNGNQATAPSYTSPNLIAASQNPGGAAGTYVTTLSMPFTVLFDANGGSGTIPNITGTTGTGIGNSIIIPTGNALVAKPGCTFLSWNTRRDGNGITYHMGDRMYPADGTTVLYARWSNDGVPPFIAMSKNTFRTDEAISGTVYEHEGGPAEAYDIITITWPNGMTSKVTSDADGTWSFRKSASSTHGTGSASITAKDLDGNVSTAVSITIKDPATPDTVSSVPFTGGHGQNFPIVLIIFGIIGACATSVFLNRNRYRNRS
ncbi:BspA family leucine-rich repeat surface protein [Bifidobacterium sp. ESL0728]|uniref:BspA family leucine-rich repeat surface protein n=1 Tax=Bifidobacterium sp. ESL0728 TaxID=2983220 RepID=UPI0023F8D012|nr:BspA family leucine-rich repeat surface protein [Bifidobacterium sp. ESL0728]WEV59073.1 BspA family leucine-rich repeat surface protein [Bifidobacterium sp. ESL0728]